MLSAPLVSWEMRERPYLALGRPPTALGSNDGLVVLSIPLAVARITRLAYSHAQGRHHAICSDPSILNTRIRTIDFDRLWFPLCGCVPSCTNTIIWLELPKVVDGEWVPKQTGALQPLPSFTFMQRMDYRGAKYSIALKVRFGCLTADYHHLWSKCVWCALGSISVELQTFFCTRGPDQMKCAGPISCRGCPTSKGLYFLQHITQHQSRRL